MPRIEAINDETDGCKMFSLIDLCKGSWPISLQEEYKYISFVISFDIYEYSWLLFWWKDSPVWFQKMMNQVLKHFIGVSCSVYIDDVIVCLSTAKEHIKQLTRVLKALAAHLKINAKKSEYFQHKVIFLGRTFDGFTKTAKQESVDCISKFMRPYDVHSLRGFLGLAGRFWAFVKGYSREVKCLMGLANKDHLSGLTRARLHTNI